MKEKFPRPPEAETLLRNIERRKRLLERIHYELTGEKIEVPDILIKDKVFFRFLIENYKKIRRQVEEEIKSRKGTSEIEEIKSETIRRIKEFNIRVFTLINRFATVTKKRKGSTTALVTALYNRPKRGVNLLEGDYQSFRTKVKEIAEIVRKYGVGIESITSMQHGLGIPNPEDLRIFLDFIQKKS